MAESPVESPGRLLAEALAGSWRHAPPKLRRSAAELEKIAPRLSGSGAAALVWRRLRLAGSCGATLEEGLHQAYRNNVLQAALQERTIEKAVSLLRAAGVETVLVKGWAAARLYPERGLRPGGDIDLCVRPGQLRAAEAALKNLSYERYEVDLHSGFAKFGGGGFGEIYSRTRSIKLGRVEVRVPGPEDHLRVLCVHMLREGAWRPLWLCDVAAAVESRPADFDWDCCLTERRRLAGWVVCALRLAQQLLCADVSGTPAAESKKPLPRWLVPTILREWVSPQPSMPERHRAPMASYLRRPSGILRGLRRRWPNPIEATVSLKGPFNELPRLPFQVGNCLARAATFTARLPKLLRERP